uniref:Activator of Hsp90 ATPase AHSA1-like N-terminal domain-containing protein n=1 Tax=Kalanchoe fedtschenkoi TaxID=63787 RepID=A0A7N0U1B1_KALFE
MVLEERTAQPPNANGVNDKEQGKSGNSYRYWVRETKQDAAPLPVPRKLTDHEKDLLNSTNAHTGNHLGSSWNKAGTWEEKNLNKWANDRLKELLISLGSLEFTDGRAEISEVSRCVGDAYLVTVRNKKLVGYTFELSLKVTGDWTVNGEQKSLKGHIDVAEFSFGELDDLQIEVKLTDGSDLPNQDEIRITQDLKSFLKPMREKLMQFEQELKTK